MAPSKPEVRAARLAARAALRPEELRRAAVGIDARVRALTEVAAAVRARGTVAVPLSFGAEPPTGPLVEALHARGVRVLCPVVEPGPERRLAWVAYAGPDALSAGAYGIPEPTGPRLAAAALADAAVVVVPALALGRDGTRLGRGAGYYDRVLVHATGLLIGLCHTDELAPTVPTEPHDVAVDVAVTPGETVRVNPPA